MSSCLNSFKTLSPRYLVMGLFGITILSFISFTDNKSSYYRNYIKNLEELDRSQNELITSIEKLEALSPENVELITQKIAAARLDLKASDFWLRYLEPIAYKKINGPLPVEWETEVFEKFEKPYKREGYGLTLAELYLEEESPQKEELLKLLYESQKAIETFRSDSVLTLLNKPDHFFFANRLFLLNLSAIYTTGFECPDPENTIIEAEHMVKKTSEIYTSFSESWPEYSPDASYLELYEKMTAFILSQPKHREKFDHFTFIKEYINPLFILNQQMILKHGVISSSYVDYSLNNEASSIFDKSLYFGQNRKGIFLEVTDTATLEEITSIGKLLFYDPILSGNAKRSCAGCHKPTEYFTDTTAVTHLEYDRLTPIERNSPSLVNAVHNHLLMLDGKHFTLQNQAHDVMINPLEMGGKKEDIVAAVMSCPQYKKAFSKFLKLTPEYPGVTIDHISSALTLFYSGFSDATAPFDMVMNNVGNLDESAIRGFNLFMSKAECATCHFVPQFNGVKPPYIGSEFEVLGVPEDTSYQQLSSDQGRYKMNPAFETKSAFRTGSIRNSTYTAPYMHNGVFRTMDDVLNFYNTGGGAGHGLEVANQTLSSDSLHLTQQELADIKSFLHSLDEKINFPLSPTSLPPSKNEKFAGRKVGGEY